MGELDNYHYSMENIEKYDALFNYIITARGGGKTFSMKKRMIDRFLEDGSRFVYVRRRPVEIENRKMKDFWYKPQSYGIYPELKLSYDTGEFLLGDKSMGTAVGLSTSHNLRSVDFRNVTDIYFEEFVLKREPKVDYLNDEVDKFLELYSTVAREEDVKAWFLGNRLHDFNPYFLYFDLIPPKIGNIKKWGEHAIEVWQGAKFVEEKIGSRFGKIISGTKYESYAVKNDTLTDNVNFISSIPKAARIIMQILHYDKIYNAYYDYSKDSMYVGQGNGWMSGVLAVCTNEVDETSKILGIRDARSTRELAMLKYINRLKQNRIYYTSTKVQEVCREINKLAYFGRG